MQQFCEARNRALRVGSGATCTVGNGSNNMDGFNCNAPIGTNGWDPRDSYPRCYSPYPGVPTCKDTNTEDIYAFYSNASVQKWTAAGAGFGTWTQANVGFVPGDTYYAATAFDATRNRIFLLGNDNNCRTFDPATGLFTNRTLTFSGISASSIPLTERGFGMTYIPALDSFLIRYAAAGGAVYQIHAGTFVASQFATTGGTNVPRATILNSEPSNHNIFHRFLRVPNHKGIVYYAHHSANAWFLKTHN